MTKLGSLDLSRNGFSGKLPPSTVSLAGGLMQLYLSQNNLSGTIPNYFSGFNWLYIVDLSRNQFSGTVPMFKSVYHLNLSHNLLSGVFPALKTYEDGITTLDLSYNKFKLKKIPQWVTSSQFIYNLKLVKCGIKMNMDKWKPVRPSSYSSIDLSENKISGSPSRFLSQAENLYEFQASGNKLRFDMGNLNFSQYLITMDLSRNLVYGKVPASVTGVENLNLSHNHLCGKLPATKFPASVFAGNDCLCGFPLSPCKA